MKIFGFEIRREGTLTEYSKKLPSFSEPINDQGAITVGGAVGGSYGMALDLNGSARTESELITRYRQMLSNPEIQQAVDEVVNELVSVDSENEVVKIVLDRLEISPKVKKIIEQEFKNILKLLDFSNNAYDIAQKFYVDGRLNYHLVVDPANPKEGIVELRYLDPRKVRLVREVEDRLQQTTNPLDPKIATIKSEYYIYSDDGFGSTLSGLNTNTGSGILGLKIAKDSIARITSGIINEDNTAVLSHLHPAFKPLNQLRMLEDASVIYTMTRAPERRIFYVDVGSLPKAKAEQYLYEFMARHKNKVTYNPETGNIVDDRKMMTMTEDYWFPRREGSRTTEVDTLPSSGSLLSNDNLIYFQTKLFKSLNVPIGRLQPENMYALGRSNETTREEFRFAKMIRRIRSRFSVLFDILLERQLILKEIISPEEWEEIKDGIAYDFISENFFEEMKETEILRERVATAKELQDMVGTYFSETWIKKKVLKMTDDEIEENDAQLLKDMQKRAEFAATAQQFQAPPTEEEQPEK